MVPSLPSCGILGQVTAPIRNNADFYSRVGALRAQLDDAGEHDWVRRLDVALAGSTSGEIFGDLRLQLRALQEAGVPRTLSVEPQVLELLDALDVPLGSALGRVRRRLRRLRGHS
jgi:hypothetical protein